MEQHGPPAPAIGTRQQVEQRLLAAPECIGVDEVNDRAGHESGRSAGRVNEVSPRPARRFSRNASRTPTQ